MNGVLAVQVSYHAGVSSESDVPPLPKRLSARSQPAPEAPKSPSPRRSRLRALEPAGPPARVVQHVQDQQLNLRAAVAIETGSEHRRRGQACEDIPCWACPLPSLPRGSVLHF